MASASGVGPRGFSGMIGEAAALFRQEYVVIQAAAEEQDPSKWAPHEGEMRKGAVLERARKYVAYEDTVVQRAQKLFDEMQRVTQECEHRRPKLLERNWEYLETEGFDIKPLQANLRTMKADCVPAMRALVRAAKDLRSSLSGKLQAHGTSLNQAFAPCYSKENKAIWALGWNFLTSLSSSTGISLRLTPFLNKAIGEVRSATWSREGSQLAPTAPTPKRLPAESLEMENRNLQHVARQIKEMIQEFHLTEQQKERAQ